MANWSLIIELTRLKHSYSVCNILHTTFAFNVMKKYGFTALFTIGSRRKQFDYNEIYDLILIHDESSKLVVFFAPIFLEFCSQRITLSSVLNGCVSSSSNFLYKKCRAALHVHPTKIVSIALCYMQFREYSEILSWNE